MFAKENKEPAATKSSVTFDMMIIPAAGDPGPRRMTDEISSEDGPSVHLPDRLRAALYFQSTPEDETRLTV